MDYDGQFSDVVQQLRVILGAEDGGTSQTEEIQGLLLRLAEIKQREQQSAGACMGKSKSALIPWVPPELRAQIWGVLLGVRVRSHSPKQGSSIPADVAGHMSEAIHDTELDLPNQRVVRVDTIRTRAGLVLFRRPGIRRRVARLLTFYCKVHGTSYKQGMNECLAPLMTLQHPDLTLAQRARLDSELESYKSPGVQDPYIEGDDGHGGGGAEAEDRIISTAPQGAGDAGDTSGSGSGGASLSGSGSAAAGAGTGTGTGAGAPAGAAADGAAAGVAGAGTGADPVTLSDGVIYQMLQRVIMRFQPQAYGEDVGFVGLQCALRHLRLLIQYHDPGLCLALDQYGVPPELYATPWLLTLLARGTPLPLVLRAWDFLFFAGRRPRTAGMGAPHGGAGASHGSGTKADDSPAAGGASNPPVDYALGPSILHFMSLGLLLSRRDQIMSTRPTRASASSGGMDMIFAELPQIVSRLAIRTEEDLEEVLQEAIRLRAATPWSVVASIERACYETKAPDPDLLQRLEKRHVVRITAAEALQRAAGAQALAQMAGSEGALHGGADTGVAVLGTGEGSNGEPVPSDSAPADETPVAGDGDDPENGGSRAGEGKEPAAESATPGTSSAGASTGRAKSESRAAPAAPQYLLLDCRPHAALADGLRIQGAVNLDPCLLESPDALAAALQGLRDLNQAGAHVAVMSTGRSLGGNSTDMSAGPEAAYSSGEASKLLPLYLLQRGFQRVSVVAGGFARVVAAYRSMGAGDRESLAVSLHGEGLELDKIEKEQEQEGENEKEKEQEGIDECGRDEDSGQSFEAPSAGTAKTKTEGGGGGPGAGPGVSVDDAEKGTHRNTRSERSLRAVPWPWLLDEMRVRGAAAHRLQGGKALVRGENKGGQTGDSGHTGSQGGSSSAYAAADDVDDIGSDEDYADEPAPMPRARWIEPGNKQGAGKGRTLKRNRVGSRSSVGSSGVTSEESRPRSSSTTVLGRLLFGEGDGAAQSGAVPGLAPSGSSAAPEGASHGGAGATTIRESLQHRLEAGREAAARRFRTISNWFGGAADPPPSTWSTSSSTGASHGGAIESNDGVTNAASTETPTTGSVGGQGASHKGAKAKPIKQKHQPAKESPEQKAARRAKRRKGCRRAVRALAKSRRLLPGGHWHGMDKVDVEGVDKVASPGTAQSSKGSVPLLPTVKDTALGLEFRKIGTALARGPPLEYPPVDSCSVPGSQPTLARGLVWVRLGGPWIAGLPQHVGIVPVKRTSRVGDAGVASAEPRLLLIVGPGARAMVQRSALVTPHFRPGSAAAGMLSGGESSDDEGASQGGASASGVARGTTTGSAAAHGKNAAASKPSEQQPVLLAIAEPRITAAPDAERQSQDSTLSAGTDASHAGGSSDALEAARKIAARSGASHRSAEEGGSETDARPEPGNKSGSIGEGGMLRRAAGWLGALVSPPLSVAGAAGAGASGSGSGDAGAGAGNGGDGSAHATSDAWGQAVQARFRLESVVVPADGVAVRLPGEMAVGEPRPTSGGDASSAGAGVHAEGADGSTGGLALAAGAGESCQDSVWLSGPGAGPSTAGMIVAAGDDASMVVEDSSTRVLVGVRPSKGLILSEQEAVDVLGKVVGTALQKCR